MTFAQPPDLTSFLEDLVPNGKKYLLYSSGDMTSLQENLFLPLSNTDMAVPNGNGEIGNGDLLRATIDGIEESGDLEDVVDVEDVAADHGDGDAELGADGGGLLRKLENIDGIMVINNKEDHNRDQLWR